MAYIRKPVRKKQKEKPAPINPLALREESEKYKDIGSYKLLDIIGVGGFGIVYRGLHLETGQTVAVKRFGIHGTPKEELEAIEAEISLLKNLSHTHIVKYYDSLRSDKFLDIVMEFCENGSLLSVMKHLGGKMNEKLCARYIAQTLKGLHYLHKQGVIHRDIKGANILSTTAGVAKLADFGVATKLNETKKNNSVVGTPYWMAPEIIEMKGQQSSSCDIWSVGCTIIELLTGKPPYFDLPQMSALYHIVTDDHPPLPDGITPVLADFLMQCFEKDPNRRIDAAGLLKHPWLKQALQEEEMRAHAGYTEMGVSAVPRPLPALSVSPNKGVQPATERAGSPVPRTTAAGQRLSTSSTSGAMPATTPAKAPAVAVAATSAAVGPGPATSKTQKKKEADDLDGSPVLKPKQEEFPDDLDDLLLDDDEPPKPSQPAAKPAGAAPAAAAAAAAAGPNKAVVVEPVTVFHSAPKVNPNWIEDAEEGFDDLDLDDSGELDVDKLEKQLEQKREKEVSFDDQDEPEWFDNEGFSVDPEVKLKQDIQRLAEFLSTKYPDEFIVDSCARLADMLEKHLPQTMYVLCTRAVIPIIEVLEEPSVTVLEAILQLIQKVIEVDAGNKFQQSLSLLGFVPTLVKLGGREVAPNHPLEIRVLCANFIRSFISKSDFTRKMFISGGGLPVLVSLLKEYPHYSADQPMYRSLIHSTIDAIRSVFFFDVLANPRNDFCRLFCKIGLLPPLVGVLRKLASEQSEESLRYAQTIGDLLIIFAQGDQVVKTHFCKEGILEAMLEVLPRLPQQILSLVLRTIRLIAMDQQSHDPLAKAGAVPILVGYLNSSAAEHVREALMTLFYMCRVDTRRREQVALSGIVPPLQRFIKENNALNQFAYQIFCWLGVATAKTRAVLRKHDGLQLYLDMMSNYWGPDALEAVAQWLFEEPNRVSAFLTEPANLKQLLSIFKIPKTEKQLEKMFNLFPQMMNRSRRLMHALARSPIFVGELKTLLVKYHNQNLIRLPILENVKKIFCACTAPARLVAVLKEHDWLPLLDQLAVDSSAQVIAQRAEEILKQIRTQLSFELSPEKRAAVLVAREEKMSEEKKGEQQQR